MTHQREGDQPVQGEIVDDQPTTHGWRDDEYFVDETAPPTVEGKLDVMGEDLRRLTRTSLLTTAAVAFLLLLTDAWHGQGFSTTVGFAVGGGLATLNLWILAGGYFAVIDQRAVVARVLLAVVGSMVVMFGVALYVVLARREWTLGFTLGIATPALSGIFYGLQKRPPPPTTPPA